MHVFENLIEKKKKKKKKSNSKKNCKENSKVEGNVAVTGPGFWMNFAPKPQSPL